MSQLVFIILINLIVLLTVGLGLSLFFALRQRKNRQQAIDKMLTGITKQQSGRTEDLQTKLGNPEQTGTDHSASVRELAMAENAFYQQLLVALLDTSGSKLTKVPDTVQTLLDQYLSTLVATPAQDELNASESAQAEDGKTTFDDPDDIEVALDLSELDEPASPEPKTDEPSADTAGDDVLLGGDEPDDSEPEAPDVPASDPDDIEVTLDLDELDEPDSPEPKTDEPSADTTDDDVLLGGDEPDDSEPEPAEPEAPDVPASDPDDIEVTLDLDELDEPSADTMDDDVLLGDDEPDDSEPAPAEPETPDVPASDPDDIKDTLDLDNLDELDELDTPTPEPFDTSQDEPDPSEPITDDTSASDPDATVMLGIEEADESDEPIAELPDVADLSEDQAEADESEPQDQDPLASLQDDLDTIEPAPSESGPDEASSSTEEKPAFSPESDTSKAIADEIDSLLGANSAPEPSVSEPETIEAEPDPAEDHETAPELETDVRFEENLENPDASEPDSTSAKPDDEPPAESVPEPSLTPRATTDTETQAETPDHISARSAEASLIDEPSEPLVPPEDELPEKTAAELPPATAEETKPDTPEAVTPPSDDRSQRTIAPDFAARDDDDLEFDLDLDALLEEDTANDDINLDKAASSDTPAAQASTAEDDIETVMNQAREKTPPPAAKSPSDEPDPDKS